MERRIPRKQNFCALYFVTAPNGILLDWANFPGTPSGTTNDANDVVFTVSGATATGTILGTNLQTNNTMADDLVILSNGTSVMETQVVTLTGSLALGGAPANVTYLTPQAYAPGTSHTWSINGSQFVVPYLHTNTNRGTYVLINNTSSNVAEITVDVTGDSGKVAGGTTTATRLDLGTVAANSTRLIEPAQINAALPAAFLSANNRFMGKFTVNAPVASVFATAFQNEPSNGTKRPIPVLTPANNVGGLTGAGAWKE
ncbi:MAG: hypothetical protein HY900_15040 [Deltaproteobacteria bacterium]|nr:hypothetical protein [Deltaproteobacteria bacterium]